MRTLTITIEPDWQARLAQAGERFKAAWKSGTYQGEYLNFGTPAQFFGRLTERRWEIVHAGGRAPIREKREKEGKKGSDPFCPLPFVMRTTLAIDDDVLAAAKGLAAAAL